MKGTKRYYLRQDKTGKRCITVEFPHMPNKRISTGTRDMAEAIMFAERYLESDGLGIKKQILFRDFAKDFYLRTDKDSQKERDKAFRRNFDDIYYIKRQAMLDNYIIPHFGAYYIDSITAPAIEKWVISFQGIKTGKLSSNTRNKALATIVTVLADAVRCGYIEKNPASFVQGLTEHTEEERRPLNQYEQQLLFPMDWRGRIEIWRSDMWAAYFSIMYDTGFRPSEVAGLRVCDIYQTPKGLAVFTSHSIDGIKRKPVNRVKTSGKGMENRVGLLDAPTSALLLEYVRYHKLKDEDFLFLIRRSRKDSYLRPSVSNKHFKSVCDRLDIRGVCQYCLRHTFETYRRGGLKESVLAMAMGHSGGKARDDYDHRNASILIGQLEQSREDIFARKTDGFDEIKPISG